MDQRQLYPMAFPEGWIGGFSAGPANSFIQGGTESEEMHDRFPQFSALIECMELEGLNEVRRQIHGSLHLVGRTG